MPLFTVYVASRKGYMPGYVGYTQNMLDVRVESHRQGFLCHVKGTYTNKCWALFDAIVEFGWENFEFEIIDYATSREEADMLETRYISELETLHPNGYNLTTGGHKGYKCCEASRQRKSVGCKAAIIANIDHYRSNPLSMGLPPYAKYDPSMLAFVVSNHALCKWKSFIIANYNSLEEARDACVEFYNEYPARGIEYHPPPREIEPGIYQRENGWVVEKTVNGRRYKRRIKDLTKTQAELYQLALAYIAQIYAANQ